MPTFTYPLQGHTAVVVVHGVVADAYRADPTYTEVLEPDSIEALKLAEVNAELEKRKLSRAGKLAEKKARLEAAAEEERARLADEEAARSEGGVPAVEGVVALNPPQAVPNGPTSSDADPADRDAVHAAQTEEN
jgi:hypothetical protein